MPIEFTIPDLNRTPPGGYEWTVAETGHTIAHYNWKAFREMVESHYLANGIELKQDWENYIIDEMCKKKGPIWRKNCKRGIPRSGKLSLGAMLSFLRTMGNWAKSLAQGQDPFVSQEEADRRSAICATCPHNIPITLGCGSCMAQISSGLQSILGGKTVKHGKECGSCGLCGCVINAAVWIPLEPQQSALNEETKEKFRNAPWCWKAEGL